MPTVERITQAVHRYVELVAKGSADDLIELYADDATVEDPVGGEVHIGRQAIHGFFANLENLQRESELMTIRVAGNEAAFLFAITVIAGNNRTRIEPIDVMTFNDDGKIASMKAYWSSDNVTPV
jgi:steroid Delta-isomerase